MRIVCVGNVVGNQIGGDSSLFGPCLCEGYLMRIY
jgi:hypothetical protein